MKLNNLKKSEIPKHLLKYFKPNRWLQPKQLLMLPARFAIAMQERGWLLRNCICWVKENSMPCSVKDRFSNKFEYVYFFVKNPKYFFDLDAVREPHKFPNDVLRRMQQDKEAGVVPFAKDSKTVAWRHDQVSKFNIRVRDAQKGRIEQKWGNLAKASEKEIKDYDEKNYGKKPYAVQERDKKFVEQRNLPDIKELSAYLNEMRKAKGYTIESFEEIFGNQSPHHWFNAESYLTVDDWKKAKEILGFDDKFDKQMTEMFLKSAEKQNHILGKNVGNVWTINTQIHRFAHFAVFPDALAERMIKAGCPIGGIVLDPFLGSGTTAVVARNLGRNYIGFELSKEYIKIAERRLAGVKDWDIIKDIDVGIQKTL